MNDNFKNVNNDSQDKFIIHDISQEKIIDWQNEQRKKDNFNKIIKKNGFHIKSHGRSGIIYYVNDLQVCEFYFEISGVKQFDILIFFDSLTNWILPDDRLITTDEKQMIKLKLQEYLKIKKIKAEL